MCMNVCKHTYYICTYYIWFHYIGRSFTIQYLSHVCGCIHDASSTDTRDVNRRLRLAFEAFNRALFYPFYFVFFFFFLFCRMRPSTVQSIPTVHIYTRSLVTSYVVVSHLPSHRRRRAFLVTTLTICTSQIYLFIYFFLHNVYVLLFCILYFVFVDLYLLKHTTLIKYKNNSH